MQSYNEKWATEKTLRVGLVVPKPSDRWFWVAAQGHLMSNAMWNSIHSPRAQGWPFARWGQEPLEMILQRPVRDKSLCWPLWLTVVA